MARTPNANSTRQKAFAHLDKQMDKDRNVVVADLEKKFDINTSYAATLYQDHRKQKIDAGEMTKVFVVRDTKDGKPISPHVTSHYVAKPDTNASLTIAAAKKAYTADLKDRIAAVKKISAK